MLNGPPACGKSTLARRYVEEHPLSLNLDIDVVRGLIGSWRDHAPAAGLLARSIALAGARVHLTGGHDVVVPQLVARPAFIDQAAALAGELNCTFHEIVLLDREENSVRRFVERSAASQSTFRDTAEMLGRQGQLTRLDEMYDQLMAL
uniref:AAA family ATPase n=1 Tax=Paractinoplanes polyasparticus TaxID=2856853 RepID=UPI001C846A58|nr:AAA family ATPase [Actinoplanes polyasparticus]